MGYSEYSHPQRMPQVASYAFVTKWFNDQVCLHPLEAPPPLFTSAPGLGSPLPRLHRDLARPAHICAGTGLNPPTSAPGLGSTRAGFTWGGVLTGADTLCEQEFQLAMRQSLADALEHHSTVDMRLTAEAPTIVVPMQERRRRQGLLGV